MRKIDLYDHNRTAYEKAERMLNEEGRAAIIHPTGTGKSFIAYALIERHPEARFVWLAPTEYIYNHQIEKLWQKQHVRFRNVTFYTYNRLMWHEEIIDDLKPDYVILDEFHRAGAHEWGKTTKKLLDRYPKAKVLGLSATNIRYLDKRRDMADELFDDHVASEMSVCDAMAAKILPEPKYVITVYAYDERLKELERRVEVMQNGYNRVQSQKLIERLRRALEKADGMGEIFKKHLTDRHGKIIVFCTDSDRMFEMVAKVPEWFYGIDATPHIYRVYSYNPESEEDFQKFKDDESEHLKILFCIDMLNEGIHVDGVSAVVLCRPTISPIVYKQQIGRALAAGSAEYPVIFDLVNNFDSLSPIADFQNEYKKAKGYATRAKVDNSDFSGFEVIDELKDCRSLMEQIQLNIETSWDVCYRAYAQYVEENGTPRVPRRYITEDGLQLGKWLQRQKKKYREEKLTDNEITMLEKCGIDWEYESDANFNHWVELLKKYREKYGDLRIPYNFVWDEDEPDEMATEEAQPIVIRHEQRIKNNKLGRWCFFTKRLYQQGKLLPERIKLLEDMGFTWENFDYYWEEGYGHAKAYFKEHGNISCKTNYVCDDGYKLGSWINRQRKVREGKIRGIMTDDKIRMLDELGMVWNRKPIVKFDKHIESLKNYITKTGTDIVPSTYVDENGVKLGPWIAVAKREHRQGILSDQKKELLEKAGFHFHDYTYQWYENYLEAKKYYEENGNVIISIAGGNEKNSALLQWVNNQRRQYNMENHGRLSEEQVKLLDEIDISEGSRYERDFERGYSEFLKYMEKYDDALVPINYVSGDGFKLGQWVSNQKDAYNSGKMRLDRFRLLADAGMIWENFETVRAERYWNEMYQEAKKYANEHGGLKTLPVTYVSPEGKKLGQWISQQRRIRKGNIKHSVEMTPERISMLNDLGMDWNPQYCHKEYIKKDIPNK